MSSEALDEVRRIEERRTCGVFTEIMSNSRVCHFKLVLLGDTAVGKSCLVVRFVRDEFFEFQEPTIGGEQDSRGISLCAGWHLIIKCTAFESRTVFLPVVLTSTLSDRPNSTEPW